MTVVGLISKNDESAYREEVQRLTACSNHIKFADDMTVVGLISKNDESAYREEVQRLTAWSGANNLSLNIDKTKEMVVDFRRTPSDYSPLIIDGSSVEIVKSTKFLGVHLADNLTWSLNTSSITKKAQQRLCFLRRLVVRSQPPSKCMLRLLDDEMEQEGSRHTNTVALVNRQVTPLTVEKRLHGCSE
ncbi:hypothetical protein C0J45_19679 [Silurus meridionalis]|nr:hypothetical protein C0J45_19679 [Silurus meridionalis]